MTDDRLILKFGKRFVAIDLVQILSENLKRTKSDIRRVIKEGGLTIISPKGTKWSET